MPSFEETYARHADRYDELVRHEDRANALGAALDRALAPRPAIAVELGCGTGRVTRLIASRADRVRAYDGSSHMVAFARERCALPNVVFGVADNAALPEPDGVADAVLAGWSIGHVTGFFPDAWREHARRAVGEMVRVARAGATLVVCETMGTCVAAPGPPNARLGELYAMLEGERGRGGVDGGVHAGGGEEVARARTRTRTQTRARARARARAQCATAPRTAAHASARARRPR